jgi:ADP-ribose pyrophosphatase YjhB (NUDIX family)
LYEGEDLSMTSSSHVNRRTLMKRSAAAGVLAVPAMGALSACASGSDDDGGDGDSGVDATDENPLGVDPKADLEVVIFDGGLGDQYALDAGDIYMASYGKIDHSKTQEIRSRLQPRMVAGDPPDMINNAGAEQMDMPALISNDQVADLSELFDAPSLDDPNVTVRETLVPGTEQFPRMDPAVIMLVHRERDGREECLLGNNPNWDAHRFSVLAGFVEAGESLEQAVIREVAEEVGVAVDEPVYLGSQPWPFPRSLMLGYTARAAGEAQRTDHTEIASMRWLSRRELRAATHAGEVLLPGHVSIARKLIEHWQGEDLPGDW